MVLIRYVFLYLCFQLCVHVFFLIKPALFQILSMTRYVLDRKMFQNFFKVCYYSTFTSGYL